MSTKLRTFPPNAPVWTQARASYGIIGLIAIIWLLTELAGGSSSGATLHRFGSMHGQSMLFEGEYWRAFTAIFLHSGFQHLAFNSISLLIFGPRVEEVFGPRKLVVVFLLAGLFGNLASFMMRGLFENSVGASGGVFGILGMFIAFFWYYRDTQGGLYGESLRGLWVLVAINLFYGFTQLNVNNTAHIGGLVAGIILGYSLVPRYERDLSAVGGRQWVDRASLVRRWWVIALSTALLICGFMVAIVFWTGLAGRMGAISTDRPRIALACADDLEGKDYSFDPNYPEAG